jgi:gliding motility-associated lipoprotein GldD
MRNIYKIVPVLCVVMILFSSCKRESLPKPRGFFRIDFPEKKYTKLNINCPYIFEYPEYGIIETVKGIPDANCWINISFPAYKAKIHLTYKDVDNNLAQYIEDIHTITYKHVIKADDIIEIPVINDSSKVYGIIYGISGNTASSINFFVTDSSSHFLSGALYFSSTPNADSLGPCLQFFRKDVVHLIESLQWK